MIQSGSTALQSLFIPQTQQVEQQVQGFVGEQATGGFQEAFYAMLAKIFTGYDAQKIQKNSMVIDQQYSSQLKVCINSEQQQGKEKEEGGENLGEQIYPFQSLSEIGRTAAFMQQMPQLANSTTVKNLENENSRVDMSSTSSIQKNEAVTVMPNNTGISPQFMMPKEEVKAALLALNNGNKESEVKIQSKNVTPQIMPVPLNSNKEIQNAFKGILDSMDKVLPYESELPKDLKISVETKNNLSNPIATELPNFKKEVDQVKIENPNQFQGILVKGENTQKEKSDSVQLLAQEAIHSTSEKTVAGEPQLRKDLLKEFLIQPKDVETANTLNISSVEIKNITEKVSLIDERFVKKEIIQPKLHGEEKENRIQRGEPGKNSVIETLKIDVPMEKGKNKNEESLFTIPTLQTTKNAQPEIKSINEQRSQENVSVNENFNKKTVEQFAAGQTKMNSSAEVQNTELAFKPFVETLKNEMKTSTVQNVGKTLNVETPQNLIEGITKSIVQQVKEQTPEVKITLSPGSLGELTLKVSVEENRFTAHIDVSSQQVKVLLESNVHALKEALSHHGLEMQKIQIQTGNESYFSNSQHQSQQQSRSAKQQYVDGELEQETISRLLGYNTIEMNA